MKKTKILLPLILILVGFCTADSRCVSLVGNIDLPDLCREVHVSGDYAYIVKDFDFHLIDVSDPSTPINLGLCDAPSYIYGSYLVEDYLFLACKAAGIRIYDISVPTTPALIGSIAVDEAFDIFVVDNYAYVANGTDGLRIFDISSISTPIEVGFFDNPDTVRRVIVDGDYALTTDSCHRLIDISSPSSPVEISTFLYSYIREFHDNYIYVGDRYFGLRILDVSTPTMPVEVCSLATRGICGDVHIVNDLAFIGNLDPNGLQIIDISNLANPFEVCFYTIDGWFDELTATESYLFALDAYNGLFIFDNSGIDTFDVQLYRGWNLFSIPTTSPEAASSFGPSVFVYDNTVADYFAPDSIFGKKGYWALGMATDTIAVGNDMAFYEDTLYRGWNLIGAVCHPISCSHISTDPPGLGMSHPYGWDGMDYFLADSLYPGKGYWFLSSGNGRITVGP